MEARGWSAAYVWFTRAVSADANAASNIECGSWRDLAKLTAGDDADDGWQSQPSEAASAAPSVSILQDTFSTGSYVIRFDGPRSAGMSMRAFKGLDLSSVDVLAGFFDARKPARKKLVVFGGHGGGWLALTSGTSTLSVKDMASSVARGGGADVVALDACLLGCLENVVEFRGTASYVIAAENYLAWNGSVSPGMLCMLRDDASPAEVGARIVDAWLAMNFPDDADEQLAKGIPLHGSSANGVHSARDPRVVLTPDAGDLNLYSVSACVALYAWLKAKRPALAYDVDTAVDPSWPVMYDLATNVRRALIAASRPYDLAEFEALFSRCIVARAASPNTPPTLTGLAVVRRPLPADTKPWMHDGVDLNHTYLDCVTHPNPAFFVSHV